MSGARTHTRAPGSASATPTRAVEALVAQPEADRDRQALAGRAAARPLRERAAARRAHRDRLRHRRRRHEDARRRAARATSTTIGIDCIAMNVNDLICVGAEPIAMLDFILCREADPEVCGAIGVGPAQRAPSWPGSRSPAARSRRSARSSPGCELSGAAIGLVDARRDRRRRADRARRRAHRPPLVRACTRTATRSRAGSLAEVAARRRAARPPARRGPARADRDLRPRRARAARAPTSTSAASPTSPATASTTSAARRAGRLRDRRSAAGAAGVRADRRARRRRRRGDVRGLQHGLRLRLRGRRGRRGGARSSCCARHYPARAADRHGHRPRRRGRAAARPPVSRRAAARQCTTPSRS